CAPVTGCFARFERNSKRGSGLRQPGGRRIENDSRLAKSLVQTLIREHNAVARNLRFHATAALFSAHAAQLENVGKIRIEFDRERDINSCASIVMDSKSLMTCFLPQNLRPKEVHGSSRDHYLAVAPSIGICGINRHDRVVLSNSRTQQQRAVPSKP